MRILFLTQDDPIYIFPFFEDFFEQLKKKNSDIDVSGIFVCRLMGKRKRSQLLREISTLYGYRGVLHLLWLQFKCRFLSLPMIRLFPVKPHSIERLCEINRVQFTQVGDPNHPSVIDKLAELHPYVLVSVACPYLLKSQLLSVASCSSINIHHSPLPRYRGMMPTFWQMFHGETSVGVTIHTMTKRIDEGDVLLQDSLSIAPGETLHSLIRRSKRHGANAMHRVLELIQQGSISPCKMGSENASYFTFPTQREMREFHRKKLKAI